jgi:hypothetical protein
LSAFAIPFVNAASLVCPIPSQVNCIPSQSTIMTPSGEWQANV